jgi:hypothetical protein
MKAPSAVAPPHPNKRIAAAGIIRPMLMQRLNAQCIALSTYRCDRYIQSRNMRYQGGLLGINLRFS